MAGTHEIGPLAPARLPVRWWVAQVWIVALGVGGWAAARLFGLSQFGRRRPHPGIFAGVTFVTGASYMIMSDTSPFRVLFHQWSLGLGIAIAIGYAVGLAVRPIEAAGRVEIVARLIQIVSETGLLVILPAVAV